RPRRSGPRPPARRDRCRRARPFRSWRRHLPEQFDGGIGFCVSSIAQNGIDQTKSAEVPIWVKPDMPWKIGGWLLKFQYQFGWIGPSGAPLSSKPACDVALPLRSKAARPWQVMQED